MKISDDRDVIRTLLITALLTTILNLIFNMDEQFFHQSPHHKIKNISTILPQGTHRT